MMAKRPRSPVMVAGQSRGTQASAKPAAVGDAKKGTLHKPPPVPAQAYAMRQAPAAGAPAVGRQGSQVGQTVFQLGE